ncbi:hypothetical protein HA402_005128 [Bradysia odoriphaga]|nr:hypothetical protein HA402_005128 [Bradysia odoriphaga]
MAVHRNFEKQCDNDAIESESEPKCPKIMFCDVPVSEELTTNKDGYIKLHRGLIIGKYEVKSKLGDGTYGRVVLAIDAVERRRVALKVTKNGEDTRKSAQKEIAVLKIIGNLDLLDNIPCIKMLDCFNYGRHICIAFPCMAMDVLNYMKRNNFNPLSYHELRDISRQLFLALNFLHNNGIVHTDIKPDNILLIDGSFRMEFCDRTKLLVRRLNCTTVRLCDFGLVSQNGEERNYKITAREYRAPEVILRMTWTYTTDIWSAGCTLMELYTGNLLFPVKKSMQHLAMMECKLGRIPTNMVKTSGTTYFKNGVVNWKWDKTKPYFQQHCQALKDYRLEKCEEDNQFFEMIQLMLQLEPSRRIPLSEALKLPFFENNSSASS